MEGNPQDINPAFKHIVYTTPHYKNSIANRKKILSNFLDSIVKQKGSIINVSAKVYNALPSETNFLEILPSVLALKNILARIDTWCTAATIETPATIHQKTFSTYTPKGFVAIVLKTQLPFYYLFNSLACTVAAGNKVMIHLIDYPEEVTALIKTILDPVFNPNEVLLLTTKQKIDQSIKTVYFDFYTIISDDVTHKKIAAYVDDVSKINFLNNTNYKSCLIIDESTSATQKIDKLLYSGFMNGGELFFNNNLFLVHIDQIGELKKAISDIQKKLTQTAKSYFVQQAYTASTEGVFHNTAELTKKILKDKASELLMGGDLDENSLSISPTIIQVSPKSEFWKMRIKGPVILILPFYNIKDAILHLQNLDPINKIHLFSRNKFNINAVTSNLNAELFLINELFMDRYQIHTIHAENKAFYKGITGFATCSNLKTISIKKKNTNFEKALFNKLDFISQKWFDLFFFRS